MDFNVARLFFCYGILSKINPIKKFLLNIEFLSDYYISFKLIEWVNRNKIHIIYKLLFSSFCDIEINIDIFDKKLEWCEYHSEIINNLNIYMEKVLQRYNVETQNKIIFRICACLRLKYVDTLWK